MIILYSLILLVFQLALIPIILIKLILNKLYIMVNLQDQSLYNKYLKPIIVILGGPIIIVLSIFVDFLTLPTIIWKGEDNFEEKY